MKLPFIFVNKHNRQSVNCLLLIKWKICERKILIVTMIINSNLWNWNVASIFQMYYMQWALWIWCYHPFLDLHKPQPSCLFQMESKLFFNISLSLSLGLFLQATFRVHFVITSFHKTLKLILWWYSNFPGFFHSGLCI